MRAVVIGGGTGAPKSIRALLTLGYETSAVVAMADDGGSTGILRECADATPPGDIRKCLAAMAGDASDPLVKAFQRRFDFADDHALGNLVLYALEQETGDFAQAIALCEKILGARGHVLPSTMSHVRLSAELIDGTRVDGQAAACHAARRIRKIWLTSDNDVVPYEPALDALRCADAIVLGPGSLFTSIAVNLLIPGMVEAIRESSARVVFVCPVADTQGETSGMSLIDCYETLCDMGLSGRIDVAVVHLPSTAQLDDGRRSVELCPEARSVAFGKDDVRAIEQLGTKVHFSDLTREDMPTWHDDNALAQVLREVL